MLTDIVHVASTEDVNAFTCVKRVLVGAGPVSSKLAIDFQKVFPAAAICTAYGMTEACSSITFWQIAPQSLHQGASQLHGTCVGQPPAGIDICVRGNAHAG